MCRAISKTSTWAIVLLMVCLTTAVLAKSSDSPQSVTGCLQKGMESKGFYLVSSDNHHWELYPNADVNLSQYVGKTVTVNGGGAHRTAAQEEKSQPYEKQETGTMEHADFQVSSVTVVSQTCSK